MGMLGNAAKRDLYDSHPGQAKKVSGTQKHTGTGPGHSDIKGKVNAGSQASRGGQYKRTSGGRTSLGSFGKG